MIINNDELISLQNLALYYRLFFSQFTQMIEHKFDINCYV